MHICGRLLLRGAYKEGPKCPKIILVSGAKTKPKTASCAFLSDHEIFPFLDVDPSTRCFGSARGKPGEARRGLGEATLRTQNVLLGRTTSWSPKSQCVYGPKNEIAAVTFFAKNCAALTKSNTFCKCNGMAGFRGTRLLIEGL